MNEIITFNASKSHDNIGIRKYEWLINSQVINGKIINYIFTEIGDKKVTLRVCDECCNRAQTTITVSVEDNEKPVADAGNNLNIDEGTEVILDGSESYDNVGIKNYTWMVDKNTSLYGSTPEYIFEDPGTYFVELNVTVEAGNYDKDIIIVWVKDTTDPVADAGQNWTIYTDQKVELFGSGSYDNYRITRYEWHIGNEVYYGETIITEFSKVGEFKVTLKVIDDAENLDTDPIYVTVNDGKKPTADAGEDSVVVVDEKVMLNGKYSSDNVGIVNYTWTIVEKNEVVYGESAVYKFEESGTYTVRLTVRDGNNNIDQDSIKIEVEEKEEPLSFLNILLPIIIFVLALVSLFIFFYTNESKKDSKKEIKKDEEEKTTEEEETEDISREEIVSKLESGELTPKQLEELMAESQKKMRKDIAEIYQYLEVLRSKARQYREGKAKESKEEEESKQQEDKVSSEPEKESEPQEQKPTEPQEAPPELDEMPDEGEENMEDMMKQLEDMDDSEAPDGFPTPDDEEPPSLEDAAETGDISQDDIDDLFH